MINHTPFNLPKQDGDSPEEWRDIPGFEGHYMASNLGRVFSVPRTDDKGRPQGGKLMAFRLSGKYFAVHLCKNGIRSEHYVHRLILSAFVTIPDKNSVVNHRNGEKIDNRLENLEWVSASENMRHSFRELSRKPSGPRGADHHQAKLTENEVRLIRMIRETEGWTHSRLALQFKVSKATIRRIVNRTGWRHIE